MHHGPPCSCVTCAMNRSVGDRIVKPTGFLDTVHLAEYRTQGFGMLICFGPKVQKWGVSTQMGLKDAVTGQVSETVFYDGQKSRITLILKTVYWVRDHFLCPVRPVWTYNLTSPVAFYGGDTWSLGLKQEEIRLSVLRKGWCEYSCLRGTK
jgi:hypothetical protein